MARNIVASVINERVARSLTDAALAQRLRHMADKGSKAYDAGERRAYLTEAARRLVIGTQVCSSCGRTERSDDVEPDQRWLCANCI